MQRRPLGDRFAPREEGFIGGWKFPSPVDALAGSRADDGHQLLILRRGLEIVESGERANGLSERWMASYVRDSVPIDKHAPGILQASDISASVSGHCRSPSPVLRHARHRQGERLA